MDSSEIKAKVIVSVNSSSIQTLYTCILNKKKIKNGRKEHVQNEKNKLRVKMCTLCSSCFGAFKKIEIFALLNLKRKKYPI